MSQVTDATRARRKRWFHGRLGWHAQPCNEALATSWKSFTSRHLGWAAVPCLKAISSVRVPRPPGNTHIWFVTPLPVVEQVDATTALPFRYREPIVRQPPLARLTNLSVDESDPCGKSRGPTQPPRTVSNAGHSGFGAGVHWRSRRPGVYGVSLTVRLGL